MKRSVTIVWLSLVLALLAIALPAAAQSDYFSVSGIVKNSDTGKPLPYVNVSVGGEHVSTVTNADGYFVLKTPRRPTRLVVSHVGFRSRQVALGDQTDNLQIALRPSVVTLGEVVVNSGDPRDILRAAIAKIPDNYSRRPELFRGFYRETTQKGHRYIYLAEAVVDMYKSDYVRPTAYDRVRIDKARRLISTRQTDTLGAKVQGGPTLPIYMDVAKNLEFIFDPAEMEHYDYQMAPPATVGDRPQLVIDMRPRHEVDYALYYGKIYIDRATLSFSRVELDLDMSDREKATQMMLVRKPLGVRFRPKEMKLTVSYVTEDSVTRISYVQSTSVFNCEWRRRLFHSSYRVTSEMVVTDRYAEARQISGHSSFANNASLYDKVELFEDPGFWGRDNIIEPTESLEKAIGRLRRQLSTQAP